MKNIWKYILSGVVAAILCWVVVGVAAPFFNGMPLEAAVALWVGMFLACEMVILTGIIISKIENRK